MDNIFYLGYNYLVSQLQIEFCLWLPFQHAFCPPRQAVYVPIQFAVICEDIYEHRKNYFWPS